MADEPTPRKTRPALRVLAGLVCPVFLALVVLYFPPELPNELWRVTPALGALVGAAYCGTVAATGRAPRM